MIANGSGKPSKDETINRLASLEEQYLAARMNRDGAGPYEAQSSYAAGEVSRMNPAPRGVDPLGTDADYHYRSEANYFLSVERGRAAVRNHPLVEQGINRLIANLRFDDITLDVNSEDGVVNTEHKAWFSEWANDKRLCDHEQARTLTEINDQSFFNQVAEGDILHLPLADGSIQTVESHHMRTPWGHRSTGHDQEGIIHGAEVRGGRTVAYWVTPHNLLYHQSMSRRSKARRYSAYAPNGDQIAFYCGFTHRFFQRRGISRLSPPRDAMNGADDLNYAHIKSALRRALISYLMESNQPLAPNMPIGGSGRLPQSGDRHTEKRGLGLETAVIEQSGEAAQVIKSPEGYSMKGWNADMPGSGFFEHSAHLLTMLAVNLDLPLMFLLLDGSLVNFHGGRMTFDQAKMRFVKLQNKQIRNFLNPVYQWKTRQRITPGSPHFDRATYNAVQRGVNLFKYQWRKPGWPYVKPLEDIRADQLAETSNLKSHRAILAARGIDLEDHRNEVVGDRVEWARKAIIAAKEIRDEFPEAEINVSQFFRELWYGPQAALANAADLEDAIAKDEAIAKPDSTDEPVAKPAAKEESDA